jgi:hypothetical protein
MMLAARKSTPRQMRRKRIAIRTKRLAPRIVAITPLLAVITRLDGELSGKFTGTEVENRVIE